MLRFLYILLLFVMSTPGFTAEHILMPMIGYSKWSESDKHTVRGTEVSFADEKQTTSGFQYLYLFDNNIAIGGNIYAHELDVATAEEADKAAVAHVHALIEYFFIRMDEVSFFAGAGYGFSAVAFTGGNLNEKASGGSSYEFNGGVHYRISDRVGLQLEYKYTRFDVDAEIDNLPTEIDSSSDSLLMGLTIHL